MVMAMDVASAFPGAPLARIRVEDYDRLVASGAFSGRVDADGVYREDKVELLDGVLYVKEDAAAASTSGSRSG